MTAPVTETRRRVPREVGVSGLSIWNGYLDEEFLVALKGDRHLRVYKEMECDPTIAACLAAIRYLMRQVDWRVEPEDESDQAADDAAFVDAAIKDMDTTWSDTLSEILSMIVWGYAYHELVYKRNEDGAVVWKAFAPRSQDTRRKWDVADNGDVQAMVQAAPPDYRERTIPRSRALHFRTDSHKGNPEGRSLFRGIYKAWFFKSNLERLEGIAFERNAAGIPLVRIPSEIITDSDRAAEYETFKKLASGIRRDEQHGVVLPSDVGANGEALYDLSLLSVSGATGEASIHEAITRWDQRIAQGLLCDVILLGHEKVGSFALADAKTNLLGVALGALLDVIADEINRQAIPQLMTLNARTTTPVLIHGDVETVDLGELGDYITKLSGAGMPLFPDRGLEAHLRAQAGLPEMTPEEMDARDQEIEDRRADMTAQMQSGGDDDGESDTVQQDLFE